MSTTRAMRQLPKTKRPRERLSTTGAENLTSAELLAVILGSGTSRQNVLSLAKTVLKTCDQNLAVTTPQFLVKIHGIGPVLAGKIMAVVELGRRTHQGKTKIRLLQPSDVLREVNEIRHSHREQLVGLYLNARYELLAKEVLAVGRVNTHHVEARDVLAPAIMLPSRSFLLVHNHPSGDPRPSQDDIQATQRLKTASEYMGVSLLDHLIVTPDDYCSLQEQKLISTGNA